MRPAQPMALLSAICSARYSSVVVPPATISSAVNLYYSERLGWYNILSIPSPRPTTPIHHDRFSWAIGTTRTSPGFHRLGSSFLCSGFFQFGCPANIVVHPITSAHHSYSLWSVQLSNWYTHTSPGFHQLGPLFLCSGFPHPSCSLPISWSVTSPQPTTPIHHNQFRCSADIVVCSITSADHLVCPYCTCILLLQPIISLQWFFSMKICFPLWYRNTNEGRKSWQSIICMSEMQDWNAKFTFWKCINFELP